MRKILDLSLRHKIPLWGSALIVVATLTVSVGLMAIAFDDLKRDVVVSSQGLGQTLVKTLFPALLHDDLWQAVELIEAPLHGIAEEDPLQAKAIFAVDTKMRVLVSSSPRTMPLLSPLEQIDDYRVLAVALRQADPQVSHTFEFPHSDFLHVTTPIAEEGRQLGTLVITHSKHGFLPRFFGIALAGAGTGALVLAILLPLNWYWGRRMAQPLVELSRGMNDMVRGTPSNLNPNLYSYHDELGKVFEAYREAAEELRQKAALEREVLQSERLAAVGRLAASIAHEVNNPLAGMLMALDNLKQRSGGEAPIDPHMARTLSFIERGLQHIAEIVRALLVEARVQMRPLTLHDLEDVRTLIEPQAMKKSLSLDWNSDLPETLPIAASLVRQILINLLLNAIEATPTGGVVRLEARIADSALALYVVNDGTAPPANILAHIFEPFVTGREGGHGLGLWVVYQIVQQLEGHIGADSGDGKVIFRVRLPLNTQHLEAT